MTCAATFSINYGLDEMLEILLPWRNKLPYLLLVTCPYHIFHQLWLRRDVGNPLAMAAQATIFVACDLSLSILVHHFIMLTLFLCSTVSC